MPQPLPPSSSLGFLFSWPVEPATAPLFPSLRCPRGFFFTSGFSAREALTFGLCPHAKLLFFGLFHEPCLNLLGLCATQLCMDSHPVAPQTGLCVVSCLFGVAGSFRLFWLYELVGPERPTPFFSIFLGALLCRPVRPGLAGLCTVQHCTFLLRGERGARLFTLIDLVHRLSFFLSALGLTLRTALGSSLQAYAQVAPFHATFPYPHLSLAPTPALSPQRVVRIHPLFCALLFFFFPLAHSSS